MKRTKNSTVLKKPLHKDDLFIYQFLILNKVPVDIYTTSGVYKNTYISKVEPYAKNLYLEKRRKPIKIEKIKQMLLPKKEARSLINAYPSKLRYFDRYKGKITFIDTYEKKKIKTFKAKFEAMLLYQIAVETQEKINLVYKIHLTSFSFINPYPENLIELTPDKDRWEPGAWREEYKLVQEIWEEEIEETKKYAVYLALKDGRNIKGLLSKGFIFESLIRLFSPDRKKSIFIMNHAIDDVLDIVPFPS